MHHHQRHRHIEALRQSTAASIAWAVAAGLVCVTAISSGRSRVADAGAAAEFRRNTVLVHIFVPDLHYKRREVKKS
jgi:hypothetical protein